jgi:hypothetical protein
MAIGFMTWHHDCTRSYQATGNNNLQETTSVKQRDNVTSVTQRSRLWRENHDAILKRIKKENLKRINKSKQMLNACTKRPTIPIMTYYHSTYR